MKGLATASVMVVDNDPNEALPLLQAFSKNGVGAIYLDAQVEHFPVKGTLRGVRLILLDVHLSGADLPDEAIAHEPINLLNAVMDQANGPYLVVLWTTKPEMEQLVRDLLVDLDWPPVALCVLSKADVKDDGDYDLAAILERVNAALVEHDPLYLLNLWGQAIHDAASATIASIAPLEAADWTPEVREILAALVRENTPVTSQANLQRCIKALFEALDQVHEDHLDQASETLSAAYSSIAQRVADKAQGSAPSPAVKQRVNRSLLLGPVVDNAAPGSIYLIAGLAKHVQTDFEGLVLDTLERLTEGATDDKKVKHAAAVAAAVPLAIELTAACDFQNGKRTVIRLLGGIALPPEHRKLIGPRTDYVRDLPPMAFDGPPIDGPHIVYWNLHYLVSRAPSVLKYPKAEFRLRQAALADLTAAHANHSSRPGILAVH